MNKLQYLINKFLSENNNCLFQCRYATILDYIGIMTEEYYLIKNKKLYQVEQGKLRHIDEINETLFKFKKIGDNITKYDDITTINYHFDVEDLIKISREKRI